MVMTHEMPSSMIEQEAGIIQTGNPLEKHYSRLYKKASADSNPHSRTMLRKLSKETIWELGPEGLVIDIGSGPQPFEYELFTTYGKSRPQATFITVDIADIAPEKLKAANYPNVHHVRADAAHLPFPPDTADVIVSNMGIEYLGDTGLQGIHDVLKPNGVVFANWWTSRNSWFDMPPHELCMLSSHARAEYEAWKAFEQSGIAPHLGKNEDEIQSAWEQGGFVLEGFEEIFSRDLTGESWYQITARKPAAEARTSLPFETEEFNYQVA